ncbi:hypothetical protein [Pyxidicoccus trucidator]|uniref:hypothetical protein n=1 Tax=Pyxidicoccus trucidator TaxID=2709662 RepID=UPI0013DB07C3|nr:hypothetical protein [Pyxidicoccus trucidator]
MRHNKTPSIALLLLCMTGGALAAGDSAPAPLEEVEAVCSEPLALSCPSYCNAGRVVCIGACNGDEACRQACIDAYIDCCKY